MPASTPQEIHFLFERAFNIGDVEAILGLCGPGAVLVAGGKPVTGHDGIRDTPFADYDVPGCLAQAEWDGHTQCPAPLSAAALSPGIYAAEVRAAQDFGNVKVLDLSDRMCGLDRCYLEAGGQVIYRDEDHLTASYSRSLAAVLFQRLRDSEQ